MNFGLGAQVDEQQQQQQDGGRCDRFHKQRHRWTRFTSTKLRRGVVVVVGSLVCNVATIRGKVLRAEIYGVYRVARELGK